MIKLIWISIAALLGLMIVAGCGRRSGDKSEVIEGAISEYLPITLQDQFRLTISWAYPNEKTYFTETELDVLYRAISSFHPYGPAPPWGDEVLFGMQRPILYVTNENHEITVVFFYSQWGTLASVTVDDEPVQWFTVDSDTLDEIVELLRSL